MCSQETQGKCESLKLFGAPDWELPKMQRCVEPGHLRETHLGHPCNKISPPKKGDSGTKIAMALKIVVFYHRSQFFLRWHVCRGNFWHEIFVRGTNCLTNAPKFSPKFSAFILWVRNKSRKIPAKFPAKFPSWKSKKIHRRASARAQGENFTIRTGWLPLFPRETASKLLF